MTFVPALRSLLPVQKVEPAAEAGPSERLLTALGRELNRRPGAFIGAAATLSAAALAAAARVPRTYSFPNYLPRASKGWADLLAVQAQFPGVVPMVVLLEGKRGFASEPATLSFPAVAAPRDEA